MQVFVPYNDIYACAEALSHDKRRFGKQITECKQILKAIDGLTKGWRNHPCTRTYRPYKKWLQSYLCCFEFYYRGDYEAAEVCSSTAELFTPPFLNDEFCNQHKRRLFTKAPDLYPQFAKYGTSEINYYYVDGELLKYKDSKRIKG